MPHAGARDARPAAASSGTTPPRSARRTRSSTQAPLPERRLRGRGRGSSPSSSGSAATLPAGLLQGEAGGRAHHGRGQRARREVPDHLRGRDRRRRRRPRSWRRSRSATSPATPACAPTWGPRACSTGSGSSPTSPSPTRRSSPTATSTSGCTTGRTTTRRPRSRPPSDSARDLREIAYDAGVQMGRAHPKRPDGSPDKDRREAVTPALDATEARVRSPSARWRPRRRRPGGPSAQGHGDSVAGQGWEDPSRKRRGLAWPGGFERTGSTGADRGLSGPSERTGLDGRDGLNGRTGSEGSGEAVPSGTASLGTPDSRTWSSPSWTSTRSVKRDGAQRPRRGPRCGMRPSLVGQRLEGEVRAGR